MEVMGSDGHLLANNVEGVGSVPPPLSQQLRQGNTSRPLRHQMDNRLETHSIDMTSSLLSQEGVPHQDPASATPTRIWD